MSPLQRRLTKIEATKRGSRLDPWSKQWLGIELSAEEQGRIDNEEAPEFDGDLSHLSREVREWLQLD